VLPYAKPILSARVGGEFNARKTVQEIN